MILEQLPFFGNLIQRGQEENSEGFAGVEWANWLTFFAFVATVFWAVQNFDEWFSRKVRRA